MLVYGMPVRAQRILRVARCGLTNPQHTPGNALTSIGRGIPANCLAVLEDMNEPCDTSGA